ncbi:hypothetical protein D0862_10779 [Hortaea werneckii]|uniref:Uncharacterized protein n=1 Tax=Hortaea werneckii TaxID=91943 RepID=A0A3M7FF52_HORWE|nr:hypothetical protein D0862_10779 [Hortaea werneckii]
MHTSIIASAFTALLALSNATPLASRADVLKQDFLLVTTSQAEASNSATALADVSATSLFDPYNQQNYLLRTIADTYASLPRFNLTNGDLHTRATGIEGVGTYVYNSTGTIRAGQEFMLSPQKEPKGNLALKDGYLLTVGGEAKGWTICEGELGLDVLYWKGNGSSCSPTYVHAVTQAPY